MPPITINNRILIVEDEQINQKLLARLLTSASYDVQVASTGSEALHILSSLDASKFDLIILDIILPDISGFEVLTAIKNQSHIHSIPVIFATSMDDRESKSNGFKLGAVDYISKPYEHTEILARVRVHIELRQTIMRLEKIQQDITKQIYDAQKALLLQPEELPQAHFRVHYQSLHAAGGDFYEVIHFNDGMTGYFIGDLAGHDVEIGFLTASIKALLKQNCTNIYNPLESMRVTNNVLLKLFKPGQYLSAVYILVDRAAMRVTYINMGHLPILHIPAYGNPKWMEIDGDLLGAFAHATFGVANFSIEPGDQLLAFTDGLIEESQKSIWSSALSVVFEEARMIRDSGFNEFPTRLYQNMFKDRGMPEDDVLVFSIMVRPISNYLRKQNQKVLSIYFPSEPALVEKAVADLSQFALSNCAKLDSYALTLCLYEVLGNARLHGNQNNSFLYISAKIWVTQNKLHMMVKDEGSGFAWHPCGTADNPGDKADSGRGFYLLESYGFKYSFNDQGNLIKLEHALSN